MSLSLPQLDDRRYADLLEEALAQIPTLYPQWTDHNPSDPGIVLIELFAWLADMLIYRIDRIPEASYWVFLELLNDTWSSEGARLWEHRRRLPLQDAMRETMLDLRERYRAITPEDFEHLILHTWPASPEAASIPPQPIARARCFPRKDLAQRPGETTPGHVSVVVVPAAGPAENVLTGQSDDPEEIHVRFAGYDERNLDRQLAAAGAAVDTLVHTPSELIAVVRPAAPAPATWTAPAGRVETRPLQAPGELCAALESWLEPRRMLGTCVHVVGPGYAQVTVRAKIYLRHDALARAVTWRVQQQLWWFFHPLYGGDDGVGWPFGRNVYLSEIYRLLDQIEGVDYITGVDVIPAQDELGRAITNEQGQVVGIRLQAHELVDLRGLSNWIELRDKRELVVGIALNPPLA
jgi:hypothetical protein